MPLNADAVLGGEMSLEVARLLCLERAGTARRSWLGTFVEDYADAVDHRLVLL